MALGCWTWHGEERDSWCWPGTAQLSLILLHPFTYSRGLGCLLPRVTLVVERNVGAHAAVPCLVQDWALHGKKMQTCWYLFAGEQEGMRSVCLCVRLNILLLVLVCFYSFLAVLYGWLITEYRVRSNVYVGIILSWKRWIQAKRQIIVSFLPELLATGFRQS